MYPPRPVIEVDYDRCGNAMECMKCILACPYRIIGLLQDEIPEPSGRGAEKYNIIVAFKILCTACKKCEEACDKGAIKVST